MARIQLRDTTIYFQDGFSATATVDDVAGIVDTDTDINIDPVTDANGPLGVDIIPVGARFTVDAGDGTVYTVTARTPADGLSATTNIVWTPAVNAANVTADGGGLTFLPQRLEIKIGEGDVAWSETKEYIYDRDRDVLDTVRQGQDQPMSVDMNFTFEYVTASTANPPTPADALNNDGLASEWTSSSADQCEPYAIDIVILHCVPCGTDEDQEITLPDFRNESLDFSIADASVATSGQCNATRATVVRSTHGDCA
jgi:hypothetical protein